jgi:signal transduction histidine kinase
MQANAAANEPIDVGVLLAEVVDELRGAARTAGMDLALAVNGNDLRVRGDRSGLKAALANLVTNALLHATSGGRAEIEARVAADVVEIRVSDRGPGLPRGLGERIFEPFVRGPEARPGGSGLGLALVREVAAKHGGRARAEDRVGGGATFTLALPRVESAT